MSAKGVTGRFRKVRQAVGVPRPGSLSREFLSRRKTHDGTVSRPDHTVRQGCERLDQDMRVRVSRADSWARLTGGMDSRVKREPCDEPIHSMVSDVVRAHEDQPGRSLGYFGYGLRSWLHIQGG